MKSNRTNHQTLLRKALNHCLFIIILCLFQGAYSQDSIIDIDYLQRVKAVLNEQPQDYRAIENLFAKDKRDSLKMDYLRNQADIIHYLEAKSYALNALGTTSRSKSQYDEAIEFHKEALNAATEANNPVLQAISLNSIGVVYRRMDLVKPALDYHTKAYEFALESYRINPDPELRSSIAMARNSMGNIYLVLKQYDLALKQFEKSQIIVREDNDILGLAINHQNIGYVLEYKGDYEGALENYQISLDYNEQIDSEIGRVICHNSIAQVYIKQERYEEALTLINQTLAEAIKLGDQYYLTQTYVNLGWTQERLNNNEAAAINLNTAIRIAKAHNLRSFSSEALLHLSKIAVKESNYEDAYNYYKESKTTEDSITNDRNLNYVNDLIIQYEHENKNKEIQQLSNENEIVRNKLERNKKLFWYTAILISLFTTMIIIIIRHRQLKQEKQIVTLEQDMLRSQMNPHFIFNSLNSIKLYIINNDQKKAVYYLNKFSKLIRKILMSSTEKEITIKDELDTMQLYINIENIRFENEIKFTVDVDEDINIENIKVPSLILQPFLENALWHGLSSKTHDKQINLHVYKDTKGYVTISIQDNGIGRKEAEKINNLKSLKRKSVGIAITKARLANFSKGFANDYKIDIEDLYNDKNRAVGTNVILRIPATNV